MKEIGPIVDPTGTGLLDRYVVLYNTGNVLRVSDGQLVALDAATYPAGAIALSDQGPPVTANHYFGDMPAGAPKAMYTPIAYRRLGASAAIGDPALEVELAPFYWNGTAAAAAPPDTLPSSRSYLTAADADALAGTLPVLAAWTAATADQKTRALEQASGDVDAAGPWQGRRYDSAQVKQFPRVAQETRVPAQPPAAQHGIADVIWDWDAATGAAVVPLDVKIAALYQADAILAGTRAGRLDALHDGLASQSVGGMSESYRPGAGGAVDGLGVLARPAAQRMAKYRLRSGRIL